MHRARFATDGRIAAALVAALLWWLGIVSTRSVPAGPPVPVGDLRPLLKQLERGTPAERDAAERALIAKGPAVLHRLPQPDEVTSPELKQRLNRIIRSLQQARLEQIVDASRLTLQGSHSLVDLVAEIERQTGNQVQFAEGIDGSRKIRVDWKNDPFWPSVDQILDEADLTVDPLATESGVLSVMPRRPGVVGRFGLADYEGAFRFEVTRVTGTRNLRIPDQSSLQVHLETAWEPRIRPIALSFPYAQFSIEYEENTPVAPVNAGAEPSFPIRPDMASVELLIGFPLPPRESSELNVMRGRCDVLLPAEVGKFRFKDLEKSLKKQQRHGQVTVTLLDIRPNEGLDEVFLNVAFERAESAFQSHFAWILDNPVHVHGDDGKKLEPLGMHTLGQTGNSIRVAYIFDLKEPLSQYELVYESPIGIVRKPVTFEIHHVELP